VRDGNPFPDAPGKFTVVLFLDKRPPTRQHPARRDGRWDVKPRPRRASGGGAGPGFAREDPGTRVFPTLVRLSRSGSIGNRVKAAETSGRAALLAGRPEGRPLIAADRSCRACSTGAACRSALYQERRDYCTPSNGGASSFAVVGTVSFLRISLRLR
jgi:hypothetical protein